VPEGRIYRFEYPDSSLQIHLGRRRAQDKDPHVVEEHTGLLNSLVWQIRMVRPTAVFLNCRKDLHPDHRLVYGDAVWAALLAAGPIWPELGSGDFTPPQIWEYMVYSPFEGPPTVQLKGDEDALQHKLEAIRQFKSQGEVGGLLQGIAKNGPVEYFQKVSTAPAPLEAYDLLFE